MPPVVDEVLPLDRVSVERLVPADWGVDSDCFVRLEDPRTAAIRMLRLAPVGSVVEWMHDGSEDKLLLTFRRVGADGRPAGIIGPPHRWVPTALRGHAPESVTRHGESLRSSIRQRVVLSPYARQMLGSGALTSRGYVGAWSDGEPVPEVLDFVLGRQYYNFRPEPEDYRKDEGTVIYLGPPQQGWGHFLTQGLARLWFALEHPDIPVLWDAPGLLPYQQQALDLLGVRNPQRFLSEPTEFAEVIFPFPGLCIGDFALPEHTRAIGRIPTSPTVAGKRLFLSRSRVTKDVSADERALDDVVVRYGFELFRPEEHTVREQLAEMSSAEVVLGLEGSAFHTPLLLQDPVATRFWALTRHRGGSGVFEHIRRAKGLRYETLNFLASGKRGGHRTPLDIDLSALEAALERTEGLATNFDALAGRIEKPWQGRTTYENELQHAQVRQSHTESLITRAQIALRGTDQNAVAVMLRDAI